MATNGSRATATYVGGINPGTWTYPATDLDNSGYTGSADDGTGRPAAYRQAWWTFIPASNGAVGLQGLSTSNPAQRIEHRLYSYDGTTLTLIEAPATGDSVGTVAVTAGTRYYLMIGTPTDTAALYGFGIYGPVPQPEPLKHLPTGMATATYMTAINPNTWTYYPGEASPEDNSAFTSSDPDGSLRATAYRQAWWTVIPSAGGTAGILPQSTYAGAGYPIEHRAYRFDGTTLTLVAVATTSYVTFSVTAGLRYYVMVGTTVDAPAQYLFGFFGPTASADPGPVPAPATGVDAPAIRAAVSAGLARPSAPTDRLALPAAHLTVRVRGRITGAVDNLACPPVTATVRTSGGVLDAVTAPPVTAAVIVPAASTSLNVLTLSAPFDGDTIATSTPDFTVGLDADDDTLTYTIEIQYAGTADFTNPVTVQQDTPAVDGGVIIPAPGPVPAHGFWRARLLLDGVQELPFTGAAEFTVDATIATAVLPVSWTVSAGAARLVHLWHFDPPGPVQGDTVTAYGQGFGGTGRLLLDGTALTVQSWTLVPATDEAGSADRTIDGDVVDPEHYEVVFTAPALNGPGGALTVEA